MPKPRYAQVSLGATPYYHCVSRCVRRAFLCGIDPDTGEDYEYRRKLIEDKILELSDIFAIDICAYAVMSNHYHLVLHINKENALSWSFDEVITRWHKLYKGSFISQAYVKNESLQQSQMKLLKETVSSWRKRLMDISQFMWVLNETIARGANKADNCTGRFWEGRFKSQALLDEASVLACMAYVDLNPIRAVMAKTPETSDYTSIKQRVGQLKAKHKKQHPASKLFKFVGNARVNMPQGLPFKLNDYIKLVDETGRIMRDDKRGFINNKTPPILSRLNIEPENWLYLSKNFESKLKGLVGSVTKLKQVCIKLGYDRTPCLSSCKNYFT